MRFWKDLPTITEKREAECLAHRLQELFGVETRVGAHDNLVVRIRRPPKPAGIDYGPDVYEVEPAVPADDPLRYAALCEAIDAFIVAYTAGWRDYEPPKDCNECGYYADGKCHQPGLVSPLPTPPHAAVYGTPGPRRTEGT